MPGLAQERHPKRIAILKSALHIHMGKLLKCHDCGHQVSQKAKTCPNCGKPDPSSHPIEKLLRGTVLIIAMLLVLYWIFQDYVLP